MVNVLTNEFRLAAAVRGETLSILMKVGGHVTVDVVVLIGITGTLSGILFGYVGYKRGEKTEHYQAGSDKGSLVSDTQYIKRRIDDVLLEQKDTNKSMNALSERVTRVEESTKSAHRRIDVEIEKR